MVRVEGVVTSSEGFIKGCDLLAWSFSKQGIQRSTKDDLDHKLPIKGCPISAKPP